MFGLHISRRCRERYNLNQAIHSTDGDSIFHDWATARRVAHAINIQRDAARHPDRAVKASQLNAIGLLDEIFHAATEKYAAQDDGDISNALAWLDTKLGASVIDPVLHHFTDQFPPIPVYNGEVSPAQYLAQEGNRAVALEELLILWLTNMNPALETYSELFDDSSLKAVSDYTLVVTQLHDFFETQNKPKPISQNLIDILRAPAMLQPHSVAGQLEYIQKSWHFLPAAVAQNLVLGMDLIQEEEQARFYGPGPALIPDYEVSGSSEAEAEAERFSPDQDWMPSVVIIAKNAFVWLHQLSLKYQRTLRTLSEIPDAELAELAGQGFTGLWLIGVWERSCASRRIKQLCGQGDIAASAYSIFEYSIAADLGGEAAMENLRTRAWKHGIRTASDMVPNHMAIDSRWLMQHPDWFLSRPDTPFPSYSFNGPDLSQDPMAGLFLEDHYYSQEDAAVVFKRVDRHTGDERYIYHGNDGTSTPWNDTAQLNYLNPEVREVVIQAILEVARRFPIIRFDAAMTLAKRHYQRLWFPEPGSAGAIPSRAECGLSKSQFDEIMPEEFWREVVDRVAREAPDTLLLAEAFWMMEGYFVRTLGMHRVYNSAFMNMLRDEENASYRLVIKNTLEFDADILKRFVNFLNNPDEDTAERQFGTGDKYFGICTLMATLPGLPMFGHGQIEGLKEKYGMEFSRAYQDEPADQKLIERHLRQIFPLLKRRRQFAEAADFLLYDVRDNTGTTNEDVFAFSNRLDDEHSLVAYHNRFATARGWIKTSAGSLNKANGMVEQRDFGQALNLTCQNGCFTIFRDFVTGLEYIRESADLLINGLYVELHAYQCHVFLDFRQVVDVSGE